MGELPIDRLNDLAELLVDPDADDWAPEERWPLLLEAACQGDLNVISQVCDYVRNCKKTNPEWKFEVAFDHSAELLAEGTKLDQFTIGPLISNGGMGAVYEATYQGEDMVPQRVALKVICLGPDTLRLIRRLRAERHILSRLNHPNIVKSIRRVQPLQARHTFRWSLPKVRCESIDIAYRGT
jgi:hypothetical protein